MSLRVRLTLLTGALTGSAILIFAGVFYLALERNLLRAVDARLGERAQLIQRGLLAEQSIHYPDIPELSALTEFDSPGIYVEVLGINGLVQEASRNVPLGGLPQPPTLLQQARIDGEAYGTVTAGADEELRMRLVPIAPDTESFLVVAESLEPVQRNLAQARVLLFVIGTAAVALAVILAALLTRQMLMPIHQLTNVAAQIAATGCYERRVPAKPGNNEVATLATTINRLIATVERSLTQQRLFLADTSHELRSPLTVVLANLNLLRRPLAKAEQTICIEEATAETQRMRRLVNDLLLLAQADAAQVVSRTTVRLDKVIETTAAMVARQAPDHVIQIHIEGLAIVSGDRERLTQIVRNLLENAVLHTPAGTRVIVQIERQHHYVQFQVCDTGPGIAPEHLTHLWDRFYRVDKARSRMLGGTGLGLAIVKYLVEAHGGSVDVQSTLGNGTTFRVLLPILADQSEG